MENKKVSHGALKHAIGSFEDYLDNMPHELKNTKQHIDGPDSYDFKGMRDQIRGLKKTLKDYVEKSQKESAPKPVVSPTTVVSKSKSPVEYAGSQEVTTERFASQSEVNAKHEADIE